MEENGVHGHERKDISEWKSSTGVGGGGIQKPKMKSSLKFCKGGGRATLGRIPA
jgi:hypothetical protein